MTIQDFAEKHRLHTRRDDCGETVIPGKRGASHIFEYGNQPGEEPLDTFGVVYMPDPSGKRPPTTRQWTNRKAKMLAAGLAIVQDCDGEGTARFDPGNEAHVKLAIQVADIRRKRIPSEAQLAVLEIARNRSPLCAKATSAA